VNPLRESSVVLLAMVVATASAAAQSDQPATQSGVQQSDVVLDWRGIENNFYANAKPYVDLSLADLRGALPELRELEPAQNQDQLPSLLNKTGERTRDLMHNMPNLIAEETLTTRLGAKGKPARQDYEYLILSHRETKTAPCSMSIGPEQTATAARTRKSRSPRGLRLPGYGFIRPISLNPGFAISGNSRSTVMRPR
jgi:hypothetical protein